MAKFSHFAIAAARQAINDAQWIPETDLDKERTVKKKERKLLIYLMNCI